MIIIMMMMMILMVIIILKKEDHSDDFNMIVISLITRDIDINRYNAIAAPHDSIRVMIVPSTISTATHAKDPTRLRHLIVDLVRSSSS